MIVDRIKFFGDKLSILGESSQHARLKRQNVSVGEQRSHDDIHATHPRTLRNLKRRSRNAYGQFYRLSVGTPAWSPGMRTGGRPDVAVNAWMVIRVEPSGALRTVIGTIAETSALLRQ
jgi:hypothetical protein